MLYLEEDWVIKMMEIFVFDIDENIWVVILIIFCILELDMLNIVILFRLVIFFIFKLLLLILLLM